jgi:oxygen-dependent protoporphyrinogen oxidase
MRRNHRPATTGPATLRDGGLSELTEALARAAGRRLRCGRTVVAIERCDAGRYALLLDSDERLTASKVVLALPASRAGALLGGLVPEVAAELEQIRHAGMRVLGLGFRATAFDRRPQGFGFLAPPGRGLRIIGATVSSNAFPDQAPPGRVLVRAFAGGVFAEDVVGLSTGDALELALEDLQRAWAITGDPEFVHDSVWRGAIPQYRPGHHARVERIARLLAVQAPGVHVTGNSYRGIGLDDTIRNALELGENLARHACGNPYQDEVVATRENGTDTQSVGQRRTG